MSNNLPNEVFEPMKRHVVILLLIVFALAIALFALNRTPYAIDDAWITYRYAENLADGLGFVYNSGERVMGTSTPLYTMVLAIARLLGAPVPMVSQAIGLVAMLGAVAGVFLLGRLIHSDAVGLLAAGFLVSMQIFHRPMTYGMETPLYVCLIVFSFYAYATNRQFLSTILAALCLLLRLDGAIVAVALFGTHVLLQREIPWKPAALYVALTAPWFVFSYLYFGSLLPNSLAAKQAHTHHHLLLWMPEWLLTQSYTVIALLGAAISFSNSRVWQRILPMVVWAAGYAVAYTFSSLQGYEWYRTPLSVPLAIFAAVGVVHATMKLIGDLVYQVLTFTVVSVFLLLPDGYRTWTRLRGNLGLIEVEAVRYEAAHWLKDHLPKDAVIAVGGIGHVGYFTRNYILDAMGLVSPQVITTEGELENPNHVPFPRFLPLIVEKYKPEYVFDGFWLTPGTELPEFMQKNYYVVRTWETSDPGLPKFLLLRRSPALALKDQK